MRVSTDEQALGPEAQREAIMAFAAREGLTVASWHEDLGIGRRRRRRLAAPALGGRGRPPHEQGRCAARRGKETGSLATW